MATQNYDYRQLVRAELLDLSHFLHTLNKAEWEEPTLCEGWRVRHIVGHFVVGYSLPLPKVLWILAFQYHFNLPRAAHEISTRYGEEHSPEKLLTEFDRWTQAKKHTGMATIGPMEEHFLDHVIHHWDITIPMGRPRQLPPERKLAALDAIVETAGKTGIAPVRRFVKGLSIKATDIDWQWGEGSEIKGETQNLILALTGRREPLEKLEGAGVEILRQRLATEWWKQAAPVTVS
ncbi:MAG TPA: maleylpyruvate isomerase family mycothiol-dependent enzyme [Chloroflexia bacterium]|nr:maleylpyruvate isomerase family mycothiol-dependent enzyme [Chloroflexia bacterium]